MTSDHDLARAFDAALAQVARAERIELEDADGESAKPHLERLRADLEAERARALARGTADPEWLRTTVRWVAQWTPESEIGLIAALGQIARAGSGEPRTG